MGVVVVGRVPALVPGGLGVGKLVAEGARDGELREDLKAWLSSRTKEERSVKNEEGGGRRRGA